jgi:hypothetical protein
MPDDGRIHGRRTTLIDDQSGFARATAPATLEEAWAKVFGNDGAAGGDGVTLARFMTGAPVAEDGDFWIV